ncbi:CD36 family [Nesidiocoris tenuis]|uniref:Scavenger receptor class B member 1 n=1 Tax=Nesidiocoris tenuis TaxID=355587 RepID=A0ABN7ACK0_9HEMI|nr:CD36 family [Nesidiocoris tenuis]
MDTAHQRQNDADINWVDNLLGRAKDLIGFSACPTPAGGRVVSSSIECQPIKPSDGSTDGRCAVTYTDLVAPPPSTTWILTRGALVAIAVAVLSISLSGIMWLTSAYDNAILKLVSIRDDIDMVFDLWRLPPTRPTLAVYPFHYKNFEAVIEGKELPEVEERGPFIYREKSERVNIAFHNNATVSFQESKNLTFDESRSNGKMSDNITTPNVPLIVFLKKASTFFFIEQKLLGQFFQSLKAEPFHTVAIGDFMWGYEDDFFKTLAAMLVNLGKPRPQPFGFIAKRKGVHHDVITERTGADDPYSIGVITHWAGAERTGAWGNTSCDLIEGSDGTIFPAGAVREGKPLYIYSHDMCRRVPIQFKGTVESRDGFPVQLYNMDDNMFNFSVINEANQCYQLDGAYPPTGCFHASPCQNDVPIFFSFPHFWNSGEELKSSIKGFRPDPHKHRSFFHIHKNLGISMLVKSRIQLNVMLQRSSFISQSARLKKEKLILPIAWMEYDSGELPEHFVNTIYHLTFTVNWVEAVLRWTFTLCAIASVIYLAVGMRKNYKIC